MWSTHQKLQLQRHKTHENGRQTWSPSMYWWTMQGNEWKLEPCKHKQQDQRTTSSIWNITDKRASSSSIKISKKCHLSSNFALQKLINHPRFIMSKQIKTWGSASLNTSTSSLEFSRNFSTTRRHTRDSTLPKGTQKSATSDISYMSS